MHLQISLVFRGFLLLIKGADWLVNGSVSLSGKLKVTELKDLFHKCNFILLMILFLYISINLEDEN